MLVIPLFLATCGLWSDPDDPASFVLVEAYRTAAATVAHKATAHYAAWRDAVAPMMAAPRTSVKFSNVFPDDQDW